MAIIDLVGPVINADENTYVSVDAKVRRGDAVINMDKLRATMEDVIENCLTDEYLPVHSPRQEIESPWFLPSLIPEHWFVYHKCDASEEILAGWETSISYNENEIEKVLVEQERRVSRSLKEKFKDLGERIGNTFSIAYGSYGIDIPERLASLNDILATLKGQARELRTQGYWDTKVNPEKATRQYPYLSLLYVDASDGLLDIRVVKRGREDEQIRLGYELALSLADEVQKRLPDLTIKLELDTKFVVSDYYVEEL